MSVANCKECGDEFFQYSTVQNKCFKHAQLCKICDEYGHTKMACPKLITKNGHKRKTSGKYTRKWLKTRKKWFKENEAGYYTCYLCGKWMTPKETTLDHVIPRSNRPDLRFEFSNLQPCCYKCNQEKGSKHV